MQRVRLPRRQYALLVALLFTLGPVAHAGSDGESTLDGLSDGTGSGGWGISSILETLQAPSSSSHGSPHLDETPFFEGDGLAVAIQWSGVLPGIDVLLPDEEGFVHGTFQAMVLDDQGEQWVACNECRFDITLFPGAVTEQGPDPSIAEVPGPEWENDPQTLQITADAAGTADFQFDAEKLKRFHVLGQETPLGNGYFVRIDEVGGQGREAGHFTAKSFMMEQGLFDEVDAFDRGSGDFFARGVSHMSPIFVIEAAPAGTPVDDAVENLVDTVLGLGDGTASPGCFAEMYMTVTGDRYERGPIAIEGDQEMSGAAAVWNDVCTGPEGYDHHIPPVIITPDGFTLDPDQQDDAPAELLRIQDTTRSLLVTGLRTDIEDQGTHIVLADAQDVTLDDVLYDWHMQATATDGLRIQDSALGSLDARDADTITITDTTFEDASGTTTVTIENVGEVLLESVQIDGDLVIIDADDIELIDVQARSITIKDATNIDITDLAADDLTISSTSAPAAMVLIQGAVLSSSSVPALRADATTMNVQESSIGSSGSTAMVIDASGPVLLLDVQISGDGKCMDITSNELTLDETTTTCNEGSEVDADKVTIADSSLTTTTGSALQAQAVEMIVTGSTLDGGQVHLDIDAATWSIADSTLGEQGSVAVRTAGGDGKMTGNILGQAVGVEATGMGNGLVFHDNVVASAEPFTTGDGTDFDDRFTLDLSKAPTDGTNVLGHDRLGGNHWALAEGLWDGNGDGIAEQSYSPSGTQAIDAAPLTTPNMAPVIDTIITTPDLLAPWQILVPGMIFNASASASDTDDDPLQYSWKLPDGSEADGFDVFEAEIPDQGMQHLELTVTDLHGATDSRVLDFYVDATNQPPTIDEVLVAPCTSSPRLIEGEPVCLTLDHTEGDAGIDRTDAVVIDWEGNSVGDSDDLVVSIFRSPVLQPHGPVGPGAPTLLPTDGQFARDDAGRLLVDVDGDGKRSVGDVDLSDAPGHRLRPTDEIEGALKVAGDAGAPCVAFSDDSGDGAFQVGAEAVFLDADCDLVLNSGDLDLVRLDTVSDPDGRPLTLLDPPPAIGVWDRNGASRISWSLSVGNTFYQAAGADAQFTPTIAGPGLGQVVVQDAGIPPERDAVSLSFTVASSNPPQPAMDVSPSDRSDGNFRVFRGTQIVLQDVTEPPPFTEISSRTWYLDGEEIGTGSSLSLHPNLDDIGQHTLGLQVVLDTGLDASIEEVLDIRPQPPRPRMEWTPATGIHAGMTVTFTGSGSIDEGTITPAIAPTLTLLEAQEVPGLLVIDVDQDGNISAKDIPLSGTSLDYPSMQAPAVDEGNLVAIQTAPRVCFDDTDGDGELGPGEVASLGDQCDAFAAGDLLLHAPSGQSVGDRINALDDAAVRPDATHAVNATIALLDGRIYIDVDGSENLTRGDLQIKPYPEYVYETPVESEPFDANATLLDALFYLDRSGDGIRDAGGLYLAIDGDVLRLDGWEESVEAFMPLPAHHGVLGVGIDQGTWRLCGSDTDSSGLPAAFDFGEPAFLSVGECQEIQANDIRLQPGQDLATGQTRAAGTLVGDFGEEHGLPAFHASGTFARIGSSHLAYDVDGDGTLSPGDLRISRVDGRHSASALLPASSSDASGALTYLWTCALGCGAGQVELQDGGATLQHKFTTSGVKDVALQITDAQGESSTETRRLVVQNQAPVAHIAVSPEEPTQVDQVMLDGRSSNDPDGSISSYTWMFDDGSPPMTGPLVNKRFDEPGLYRITLLVRDSDASSPAVGTKTILLEVSNSPPQIAYTFSPAQPSSLEAVTLDASQSHDLDGEVTKVRWIIQDGEQTVTLAGAIVTYAFQTAGEKEVILAVTDDREHTVTQSIPITVDNLPPVAVADILVLGEDGKTSRTSAISGSPPFTVQFSGSRSSDPDSTISSYRWTSGGEELAVTAAFTHEFEQRGTYEIVLSVTDETGSSASSTVLVNVLNHAPAPAIIAPSNILVGQEATFRGVATDPEGDELSFAWDFGDGETIAGEEVQYTFDQTGPQEVRLTVTDDRGGTTLTRKNVVVESLPPEITLQASSTSVNRGETVTITGTAIDTDGSGAIASQTIDFGDGHLVFSGSASHSYSEPGIYRVVYRAMEANGAAGSKAIDIEVVNPPPTIEGLEVTSMRPNVGDLLLFTANVTDDDDGGLSYRWDFKDGVVSARQTPTHVYQVPGLFSVELVVTDSYGEQARKTIQLEVQGVHSGSDEDASNEQDQIGRSEPKNDATRTDKESPGLALPLILAGLIVLASRRRL